MLALHQQILAPACVVAGAPSQAFGRPTQKEKINVFGVTARQARNTHNLLLAR